MATPSPPFPSAPLPHLPSVLIRPDTVAGVRTYKLNLGLDIVFGAFALTIALVALLATVTDPVTAIGFLAILTAAACGLLIVFVINFIVSLLSVTKMHHGSREYGREHERFALRGVVFKWLGTAMSTTAAILVVYLLVSGVAFVTFTGVIPAGVYIPLLITILWTGGVTFKGQMYRHMVRVLQPPETRRWSDLASLVIPILGVVGIVTVGTATALLIGALANPASITPVQAAQISQVMLGGIFLPPGLAVVGYILFLLVYTRTADRLQAGLQQVQSTVPASPWAPPPHAPAGIPGAGGPDPAFSPTSAAHYCPQCGRAATGGALFCVNCGARLAG